MCASPCPLAFPVGTVLLSLPFQSRLPALLMGWGPWVQILLLTPPTRDKQPEFLHPPSGNSAFL